jgi:hypothetical protein
MMQHATNNVLHEKYLKRIIEGPLALISVSRKTFRGADLLRPQAELPKKQVKSLFYRQDGVPAASQP